MRTWLAGLLLLLALPVSATYAPFTVEIQDDFADGVTLAATEKGTEAIWTTTAVAGTTVSETGGNFQVTSNGATSARARIQTKPNYRTNFFVQPLKFTYTGLDFTGTPAQAGQEDFFFYLSSTAELDTVAPDVVLLSIRGSGRTEITTKIDGGTVTSLFVNTPGWTPTGATFVIDETSYFVTLTTATQQATFSGAHGLDVADWGARGDSAIALSGRHLITPADGNTAIVVLSSFRVENLKLFEGFNNGDLEDTGSRQNYWVNAGTVAETGNVRTITGTGSSVGKVERDLNFFAQKLKYRAKLAINFAGSTTTTNVVRFAVNSEAASALASDDSFAVAFNPEASGYRMRAGWKVGSASAVPETTNSVLSLTMATLPASFDLTLDRDAYSLAAFTAAGVAIDMNGATAGTTLTGKHGDTASPRTNWYAWQDTYAGDPPPTAANSAIVIENTGGFGSTVSTWDRVQVERLDAYFLAPTVYGPITDGPGMDAVELDPAEHPLLDIGFIDPTGEPFNAVDDPAVDSVNALNHAWNFARENYLTVLLPEASEFGSSDQLYCTQSLALRSSQALTVARPSSDEYGPCSMLGSRLGVRPKIVLMPGSSGFNNPASPKSIVRIEARNYNDDPDGVPYPWLVNDHLPGISFNQTFINIDLDVGTGNTGACGINSRGAQGTTIEEVAIDATGGFCGVRELPGGGGGMVDIAVTGGQYGVDGVGSLMAPTIAGLTLSGQTVSALRYNGLQTLTVVGSDITVANGKFAFDIQGAAANASKFALIDSQIKFASAAGTNTAIKSVGSLYLKNVFCQHCDKIVDAPPANNDLNNDALQADGWTLVDEYAQGIDPPIWAPATPDAQFRHSRYENGTRFPAGVDLVKRGDDDEAPPGDLVTRHLPGAFPHCEEATAINPKDAPYSATGLGIVVETSELQDALDDATSTVCLPKGVYLVDDSLVVPADINVVGPNRTFVVILADATSMDDSGSPAPILQTADDAGSTSKLGFLTLGAQIDAGGAYALNQRSGLGVVRDVDANRRSRWGFGGHPAKDTSPGPMPFALVLQSGNGGGKWYDYNQGHAFNQGFAYSHIEVNGTTLQTSFYHLNVEHAIGEAEVRITGAQNVDIYSMKSESNFPVLWIKDSDNINLYGYGGNAAAYEPTDDYDDDPPNSVDDPTKGPYPPAFQAFTPTLFRVTNTPNFRLVGLFDQIRLPTPEDHNVFGSGQPPELWHMALEVPPGSMVPSATLLLDRPILMSRVTITTPPEEIVSIAGSAVVNNGQSYAAAAGTDRAVVWAASAALGTALIDFQSATYAAQAMAVRAEGRRTTGTSGRSVSFSDVLEANLPSGASAITGTWDVAPGTNDGWGLTLDGVDQSAPVRDADSAECSTAASCTLPAMTVMAGDLVLALCQVAPGGASIAASAGYTVLFNTAAPLTAVMVKAITADGTETPGCVYGGAANSVMAGVVYAVATDAGTAIVVLKRRRE